MVAMHAHKTRVLNFRNIVAAKKICKALRFNMLIKKAIRQRIDTEVGRARLILARKIEKVSRIYKAKKLRKKGYFNATIYLELTATGQNNHERLTKSNKVEVFGEFTES